MSCQPLYSLCRPLAVLLAATAPALAQAQPSQTDERFAKLYEIGDLVQRVGTPDLEPKLVLGHRQAQTKPGKSVGGHAIARLLRAFVKPGLQANEEIKAVGERWIVALARPEQQAWIARFLAASRTGTGPVVTVNCRCLRLPELLYLQDVEPVLTKNDASAGGADATDAKEVNYVTRVLAPGAATTGFLRGLFELDGVTDIVAQSVSVRPLQVAHMATVNQTAYIKDFDVEVAQGTIIADPIVDVVQDGVVTQTAFSPLENGLLGVSLEAVASELARPIPTFTSDLGVGLPVTIQLPSVSSTRLEAAVEIEPDQIVVLVPPPLTGRRFIFIVTVENDTGKQPTRPEIEKKDQIR